MSKNTISTYGAYKGKYPDMQLVLIQAKNCKIAKLIWEEKVNKTESYKLSKWPELFSFPAGTIITHKLEHYHDFLY